MRLGVLGLAEVCDWTPGLETGLGTAGPSTPEIAILVTVGILGSAPMAPAALAE